MNEYYSDQTKDLRVLCLYYYLSMKPSDSCTAKWCFRLGRTGWHDVSSGKSTLYMSHATRVQSLELTIEGKRIDSLKLSSGQEPSTTVTREALHSNRFSFFFFPHAIPKSRICGSKERCIPAILGTSILFSIETVFIHILLHHKFWLFFSPYLYQHYLF